jgi:predicted dehydrogenase
MIKWGILGPGQIARVFANDFQYVEHAQLTGVASRGSDRAIRFSSDFNIPDIYASYEALAMSDNIDAVYIATPHHRHYQDARMCLEGGKSVLCEKPITANTQELRKLIAIAEKKGVYLMEAMWTYFLPAFNQALEWYRQGRIGRLRFIDSSFGFKAPYDATGRLYNPELAGGSLLDLGIYNLFTANHFVQEDPTSIKATAQMSDTGIDELLTVHLTFPGGAMAHLTSAFSCTLKNEAYISGSEGTIYIPRFWQAKKAILRTKNTEEIFEDQHPCNGYYYETQEFTDHLTARKPGVPYPMADSLRSMQQMDEIRRQIKLTYPFE